MEGPDDLLLSSVHEDVFVDPKNAAMVAKILETVFEQPALIMSLAIVVSTIVAVQLTRVPKIREFLFSHLHPPNRPIRRADWFYLAFYVVASALVVVIVGVAILRMSPMKATDSIRVLKPLVLGLAASIVGVTVSIAIDRVLIVSDGETTDDPMDLTVSRFLFVHGIAGVVFAFVCYTFYTFSESQR